jgi:hypothetical protein
VCTNADTSEKIRQIIRRILDKDIHLEELDYRPDSAPKTGRSVRDIFRFGKVKSKLSAVEVSEKSGV